MLVRDCMAGISVGVRLESDPLAAVALLKLARIRRLPVVDADGTVVGLVTRHDLRSVVVHRISPDTLECNVTLWV